MKNPKCAASPDWCRCHRCFLPSGSATSLFTSPAEVPSTRTLSFLRIKNGKRRKWKQDRPIYLAAMYLYIYIYTSLYTFLYHKSKTLYTYVSTYTYLCLEITIRVSHVLYVLNRPNRYASSHHHHHHHNNHLRSGAPLAKYCLKKSKTSKKRTTSNTTPVGCFQRWKNPTGIYLQRSG